MQDLLGLNEYVVRLIILLIAMASLIAMIEPEKLLYLSYFTAVVVVVLSSLYPNSSLSLQRIRSI